MLLVDDDRDLVYLRDREEPSERFLNQSVADAGLAVLRLHGEELDAALTCRGIDLRVGVTDKSCVALGDQQVSPIVEPIDDGPGRPIGGRETRIVERFERLEVFLAEARDDVTTWADVSPVIAA